MSDVIPHIEAALKLIAARGVMRTPELAVKLGLEEHKVDELLEQPSAKPYFVTCGVELAGGKRVIEYRCSATGGKYSPVAAMAARASARATRSAPEPVTGTERPAALESGESRSARATPTPAPAADQPREPRMTITEKLVDIFKVHGPMLRAALAKHIKADPNALSAVLSQGAKAKPQRFARLGGGKRSTIWGLPTQAAPADALDRGADLGRKPEQDAPPRSLHRTKKSHAGGGAAAMRKRRLKKTRKIPMKPVAKAQGRGRAFRPAIASDGALLLLGANGGDFELSREETRTVLQLVRRLQPEETGELLGFLVRLDRARVGE